LALLRNCDRGAALDPVIVDPILESWTGIKKPVSQRQTGAVDPLPYEGIYENNLRRVEVFRSNSGLTMRMSARMDLLDNDTNKGDGPPPLPLHFLGDHTFETVRTPGTPPMEYKFVQPDSAARMQFLAAGLRLLVRTE